MKLIYRANIFDYTPPPSLPYRKPRALNWRFHAPGEKYDYNPLPSLPYRKPRILNWRFQTREWRSFS